jgi:hypothetical protein
VAFLELIPPLPLLLLHPFRRRRRSEARNQSPNVYTSLGFRYRYSLGFSWRWVRPGSYELCWCARRGGRSSGAASSPIMLQIGGLSPRVASPTGHGVGDRKGLATPSSTSLATPSSTGDGCSRFVYKLLSKSGWFFGPIFLGGLLFVLGVPSSGLRPSDQAMAGGHIQ